MFKLEELFSEKAIILNLKAKNKNKALKEIANHLYTNKFIDNEDKYFKALKSREKQFSTGIGNGIAIPHTQNSSVLKNIVLIAKTSHKINWKSLDNKPVNLIFAISLNDKDCKKQTDVLQELSKLMMNKAKISNIRNTNNKKGIIYGIKNKK